MLALASVTSELRHRKYAAHYIPHTCRY